MMGRIHIAEGEFCPRSPFEEEEEDNALLEWTKLELKF
jgi:hypothetical protein